MSGLFSGRAEHGCFRLFLHTGAERRAFILVIWKPWDQSPCNVKPSAVEVFTLVESVYKKSCSVKNWSGPLQVMIIT